MSTPMNDHLVRANPGVIQKGRGVTKRETPMNKQTNSFVSILAQPTRRKFLVGASAAAILPSLGASPSMAERRRSIDLSALEARHGGRIGVCAEGLDRRVDWRAGERFAYCSTFKLFLAACMLERVQNGQERLDRPVPVAASDMVMHGPITEPAIGSTLTIEELCKATVEVSDNPAANILIREMGGLETWRAWYRSIDDQVTRVDRYETELNSAVPDDPRDTTTPEQFVANLDTVLRGTVLSPDHLALLTKWLIETPTGAGRIKAGVPDGYLVAHKTGTGARNTHNNIGMIQTPSGGSILMVVYFTGARDASPEQVDSIVAEATRQSMRALGHG